ncbi:unnamed protein product [Leuciscus chuanchicus]
MSGVFGDCPCQAGSLQPRSVYTLPTASSFDTEFTDLEGAQEAGLISAPPMEHSLATCLAPMQKSGIVGIPTLPSAPIYGDQACTAKALSTMSLLQSYQAICLGELSKAVSEGKPCDELMGERDLRTQRNRQNLSGIQCLEGLADQHSRLLSQGLGRLLDRHQLRGRLQQQRRDPTLGRLSERMHSLNSRRGGKGRDIQYPAMLNKRGGGFPGDAGDPRCQPGMVARMRTNTMGSSHDSVRLSAAVPLTQCTAPLLHTFFTKCAKLTALSPLRHQGMRVFAYLDDTREQARQVNQTGSGSLGIPGSLDRGNSSRQSYVTTTDAYMDGELYAGELWSQLEVHHFLFTSCPLSATIL